MFYQYLSIFVLVLTVVYVQTKDHNWALMREYLSSVVSNNKGADQPAHPRSLISAFGIRFLESIISRLDMSEI